MRLRLGAGRSAGGVHGQSSESVASERDAAVKRTAARPEKSGPAGPRMRQSRTDWGRGPLRKEWLSDTAPRTVKKLHRRVEEARTSQLLGCRDVVQSFAIGVRVLIHKGVPDRAILAWSADLDAKGSSSVNVTFHEAVTKPHSAGASAGHRTAHQLVLAEGSCAPFCQ
jgi:hypothetical protein